METVTYGCNKFYDTGPRATRLSKQEQEEIETLSKLASQSADVHTEADPVLLRIIWGGFVEQQSVTKVICLTF
jgi:hypothetical protein